METETQEDTQVLRQIAMLLISLSLLAESVSRRSFPVRYLVLWILRPAEAAAHKMIADFRLTPQLSTDMPFVRSGAGPNDARHLAELFLYLATALEARARQELAIVDMPASSVWNTSTQRLTRSCMIDRIKAISIAYLPRPPIDSS